MSEGGHTLHAYVLDANGNKLAQTPEHVFCSGSMNITSPKHNEILDDEHVIVTGSACPNSTFDIIVDQYSSHNPQGTRFTAVSD